MGVKSVNEKFFGRKTGAKLPCSRKEQKCLNFIYLLSSENDLYQS